MFIMMPHAILFGTGTQTVPELTTRPLVAHLLQLLGQSM